MQHRNHLQEIREEREREEQFIKEMYELYNSSTKINFTPSGRRTILLSPIEVLIPVIV